MCSITVASQRSSPEDSISYAELQTSKGEMQDASLGVWAVVRKQRHGYLINKTKNIIRNELA